MMLGNIKRWLSRFPTRFYWTVTHAGRWFWPMWAVLTIFISGVGFLKSENATQQVREEITARAKAVADAAEERVHQICDQAIENISAQRRKDESLLVGLLTDLINTRPGKTPEENARDIALITRIVHERVKAEYDRLPPPAVCVQFALVDDPAKSIVTVEIPEGSVVD